jgi:pimeloyl-ACP methyl ester carboxylesterase
LTDRPAVLLLHGQPGTGGDWAGVAAALREEGLHVSAPDRPGYGRSTVPAGGFEHNARAMAELLDGPAVVAGYSWGAGVALAMAQHHPDKLKAIVLVCPVTPAGRLGRLDRALAGRRAGPLIARAGFLGAGAALAVPPLRRRVAPLVPGADASRWPELRRAWRTFWVEQRALVDELPGLGGRFDVPATFVIGERDHVTDPAAARAYAAGLGAEVIEVPGVGHLLPMQRPAEVARAIRSATTGASSGAP